MRIPCSCLVAACLWAYTRPGDPLLFPLLSCLVAACLSAYVRPGDPAVSAVVLFQLCLVDAVREQSGGACALSAALVDLTENNKGDASD